MAGPGPLDSVLVASGFVGGVVLGGDGDRGGFCLAWGLVGGGAVKIPFLCREQRSSFIIIVDPASIVQLLTLQSRQSIAGGRSRVVKEGSDPMEESPSVGEFIVED